MSRFAVALALTLAAVVAPARAQPRPPSSRDVVFAYNTGSRFSIAPGIFVPAHGDRVGFSVAGDYRYGFELGPTILAPGVRLAGFFPSGFVALTGLATGRLTVPIGPVGPYLMGGVGPGWVSKPSEAGAALLGGGGLMVYIGRSFAIGAEATYLTIAGTGFRALFVGPSLLLGV
ncbi:MAG: hypothetical protein JWN48_1997 [Myxococcaceae bacterium]|nr:hypothetical protein [Myxococcaceae bacterium]